jgi:Tfp pilus assembly protein PilN
MINLLPLEEKKFLETEKNWRLIIILGSLILMFLIYLILILSTIKLSMSGNLRSQQIMIDTEEKELKKPEIQDIQEKITSVNQNLSKLKNFYQEQVSLTDIFEKISKTLSPGMYLINLAYQKDASKFSLSGSAPNKETLFEFKKNLEKEFKEVSLSNQSWIDPANFQVTFKIENNQ